MKRTFTTDLSVKGINNLINELNDYKSRILPDKITSFVSLLADAGIDVARTVIQSDRGARNLVTFRKTVEQTYFGAQAILFATETGQIHARWENLDGEQSADVSPLLMTEWGSGVYGLPAETLDNGLEVGRGTFPNQTHAFNSDGWYWFDGSEWHHSLGWEPTRPLFNAWQEMMKQIVETAKKVF